MYRFRLRFFFFCILVAIAFTGCGGDAKNCESKVVVNEFSRVEKSTDGIPSQHLEVELYNSSNCDAVASRYSIKFADIETSFEAPTLKSRSYETIRLVFPYISINCAKCTNLELIQESKTLDRVSVPYADTDRQYFARVPNEFGSFAIQSEYESSLGTANKDLGPIIKISSKGGFPPRDSSPNAALKYENMYWIFSGWGNYGHDIWRSVSEVWNSEDGVNWKLIKSDPPYSPYSSFLVFQNRIWAVGTKSYSSSNGIDWKPEILEFASAKRALSFGDSIYGLIDQRVLKSTDGKSWIAINENVPWGPDRKEPGFLVHNDKLFLIGGTNEPRNGILEYKNDVWSSFDGIAWDRLTESAAWEPRRWHSAISHSGRIWLINGLNHNLWPEGCSNAADIWFSENGINWNKYKSPNIWTSRHASYVLPFSHDSFIIAAGYGTCGLDYLYSDVWQIRPEGIK